MFRRVLYNILILTLSVVYVSCSKYNKIQKSQDFNYKYEKALEYYEKEDYFKAMTLFDQVMPFYRGTEQSADISFKYSYAYFYQKEYLMASYYFNRFAKTFPRNELAEEASFMSAYCKYKESPIYKLDQTNTYEAINELQLFINAHPTSERVQQCNELIDELRAKLQKKEYEIAKLYLKMDKYKAAVTSFDNLLTNYPDTKFKEDAMFYSIKAYYYYAVKSVKSKRKERYLEARDVYNAFITLYPDSEHNPDIEYMFKRATKDLEKL